MDLVEYNFYTCIGESKSSLTVINNAMKKTVLLILSPIVSQDWPFCQSAVNGLNNLILSQPLVTPVYCCCSSDIISSNHLV